MSDLGALRKDLGNSKKQAAALDAIANLTKLDNKKNRVPVRKAGMVPGLCAMLQKPKSDETTLKVLKILVDLSVEEDNREAMAVELKIPSVLAQVLKAHTNVEDPCVLQCVKCLMNLSVAEPARLAIASAGVIPMLLALLPRKDVPEARKWLLWTFTNLALEPSIAARHFNSPSLLTLVVEIANEAPLLDSRTRGVAFLRNAAKHPELGAALGSSGVAILATKTLRGGAFDRPDSSEEAALFILLRLSQYPEAKDSVFAAGAVLELKRIFSEDSEFYGLLAFMALGFLLEPTTSDESASTLSLTPVTFAQLTSLLRGVFEPTLMPPHVPASMFRPSSLLQLFLRLGALAHNRSLFARGTIVPEFILVLREHQKDEQVRLLALRFLDLVAGDDGVHVHMFQDGGLSPLLQQIISADAKGSNPSTAVAQTLLEKVKEMATRKTRLSMEQKRQSLRCLFIDCLADRTRFVFATVDAEDLAPCMSRVGPVMALPCVTELIAGSEAGASAVAQIKEVVDDTLPALVMVGLGPWLVGMPIATQKKVNEFLRQLQAQYPAVSQQVVQLSPAEEAMHVARAVDFDFRQRAPDTPPPSLLVLGLETAYHVVDRGTIYSLPKPSPAACAQAVASKGREGVTRVRSLWTASLDNFKACHGFQSAGIQEGYIVGARVGEVVDSMTVADQSLGPKCSELVKSMTNTANSLAFDPESASRNASAIAALVSLGSILALLIHPESPLNFHTPLVDAAYTEIDWTLGWYLDFVHKRLVESYLGDMCSACKQPGGREALLDPCGHVFCLPCARKALEGNATCPICEQEATRYISIVGA